MSSHPLLVVGSVLAEAGVSLSLSRILDVGIVEKVLDAEEDLLDGDGRPPVLVLVEDGEADRAGGVHVGVEQRRHELHLKGFDSFQISSTSDSRFQIILDFLEILDLDL